MLRPWPSRAASTFKSAPDGAAGGGCGRQLFDPGTGEPELGTKHGVSRLRPSRVALPVSVPPANGSRIRLRASAPVGQLNRERCRTAIDASMAQARDLQRQVEIEPAQPSPAERRRRPDTGPEPGAAGRELEAAGPGSRRSQRGARYPALARARYRRAAAVRAADRGQVLTSSALSPALASIVTSTGPPSRRARPVTASDAEGRAVDGRRPAECEQERSRVGRSCRDRQIERAVGRLRP